MTRTGDSGSKVLAIGKIGERGLAGPVNLGGTDELNKTDKNCAFSRLACAN